LLDQIHLSINFLNGDYSREVGGGDYSRELIISTFPTKWEELFEGID